MPATSKKQQRFMGAELARKRSGRKTKTNMSEKQLAEFATMPMHKDHPEEMKEKMKKHMKKPKSNMPAGGKLKGNWGDIGALRQAEAVKIGGFSDGSPVTNPF